MATFGLVKSFDIDDGELDECSPPECFVLGYELATIDQLLKEPNLFTRPVHAHNRERIEKSCRESGRRCSLTWLKGDISEEWMYLAVEER